MPDTTKIYDNQLKEDYINVNSIGVAGGVPALDENVKIYIENLPDNLTTLVVDGTLTNKGIVQLSNNYAGTSQSLAVTEKALSDGLGSVRTFMTKSIIYSVDEGNLVAGSRLLDATEHWPTTSIYGITLYKNGLYQNAGLDFTPDSITKTVELTVAAAATDRYTLIFDMLLNGDTFGAAGFYNKLEIDEKLALKANIKSPTFTGVPKAPTNTTVTDSTNQIATNEFVDNAFEYYTGNHRIVVSPTTPTGTYSKYDVWIKTQF